MTLLSQFAIAQSPTMACITAICIGGGAWRDEEAFVGGISWSRAYSRIVGIFGAASHTPLHSQDPTSIYLPFDDQTSTSVPVVCASTTDRSKRPKLIDDDW